MRCKGDFAPVELDTVNVTAIILKMICLAAINGAPLQGGIVTQPTATEAKTLLARLVEAYKSKEQLSLDRIGDQALSYIHPEQRVVVSSLWANYLFGSYDYATRLRLIGFMKANYTPDRADGAMSAYRTGRQWSPLQKWRRGATSSPAGVGPTVSVLPLRRLASGSQRWKRKEPGLVPSDHQRLSPPLTEDASLGQPPVVLTKAGKPRVRQPPPVKEQRPGFYPAQMMLYGVKLVRKTTPAAKALLLDAFAKLPAGAKLQIPTALNNLEQRLKDIFTKVNAEEKQKREEENERRKKLEAEELQRRLNFEQELAQQIAQVKVEAASRKGKKRKLDSDDKLGFINSRFTCVVPEITEQWPQDLSSTLRLAPSSTRTHIWGKFEL
ncbi:hypothetical protein HDU89_004094 [Geranomyces variabilis]|nr:hypothetical protein HDU89_004094 [Geranomyces variabilis]